jgi:hypothetical protein
MNASTVSSTACLGKKKPSGAGWGDAGGLKQDAGHGKVRVFKPQGKT